MSKGPTKKRYDYRNLAPVRWKAERPEQASQSLLGRMDVCPRSAYLYLRHGGGLPSHAMDRGAVFHEVAEKATNLMIENDEPQMPGEMVRELAVTTMKERTDLVLPESEQDAVRAMAWNWGECTQIEAERVAGVEVMVEAELGPRVIRGKIDLLLVDGNAAHIYDYKTSLAMLPHEWVQRDFQTKFYALLVALGHVEDDPMRLGQHIDTFVVTLVYPRFLDPEDPRSGYRTAVYTRQEVLEFRSTVEHHLGQLESCIDTRLWPAVPGSHCATCPAEAECPLPAKLREVRQIKDLATAQRMAMSWEFKSKEAAAIKKNLRAFAEDAGPIPYGDLILDFRHDVGETIKDKDALRAAIERLIEYGEPFDIEQHFKRRESTNFARRKQTPDELGE